MAHLRNQNSPLDGSPTGIALIRLVLVVGRSIALLLTGNLTLAETENSSTAYHLINWQVEDGLPENRIHNIVQTADGYIWLATSHSLTRFDGRTFKVFDHEEPSGLDFDELTCLYGDRVGRLWIGLRDELISYEAGEFVRHTIKPGTKVGRFNGLCEDNLGRLFAQAEYALCRIEAGRVIPIPSTGSEAPKGGNHITADSLGRIWVGWGNTLYRFEGGNWSVEARLSKIISSLVVDHDESIWCGLNAGSIVHVIPGKPPEYSKVGLGTILGIVPTRTSETLFRMSDSLHRLPDGSTVTLTLPNSKRVERILKIFQDRERNFWIGTNGEGLILLRRKPLQSYSIEQGLQHPHVTAIEENTQGTIWIGTMGGGLARLEDERFESVEFLPSAYVSTLRETRDGQLWIGTFGQHLWRQDQGILSLETMSRALAGRALFEDSQEGLWIGGEGMGAEYRTAGRMTRYDTGDGLLSDHTRCFAQDQSGAIWVGTDQGLHKISGGIIRNYTDDDGLGDKSIQTLYVDSKGILWIGTERGGLTRHRNGRFVNIDTRHGIPGNRVAQILEDDSDHLWLGTNKGLFRSLLTEIHDVLDGKEDRIHGRVFGKAEGMRNLECTAGFQPNCLSARDGKLWFTTVDGVIAVDPKNIPSNNVPPPVHISRFKADGMDLTFENRPRGDLASGVPGVEMPPPDSRTGLRRVSSGLVVPAGTKRLEIHYVGISFSAPKGVTYQYRLQGYENTWNRTDSVGVASYTRMPPGEYVFQVQSANSDGLWNPQSAVLEFSVEPQLWQTWWFQGSVILAAGAFIFAISYGPVQRKRQMERLRLRIARDLHDEVGSNLGTISLYNQLAQSKSKADSSSGAEFEEIDRTVHRTVQSLRDVIWFINPEFDTLAGMLEQMEDTASRVLAGKTVTFHTNVQQRSRHLAVDFRRNVFFIFKEVTHNILKHSRAKCVEIRVTLKSKILEVEVRDDGTGFDPSTIRKGHGLNNMNQRASEMGGHLEVSPRTGQGTTVLLKVPLT